MRWSIVVSEETGQDFRGGRREDDPRPRFDSPCKRVLKRLLEPRHGGKEEMTMFEKFLTENWRSQTDLPGLCPSAVVFCHGRTPAGDRLSVVPLELENVPPGDDGRQRGAERYRCASQRSPRPAGESATRTIFASPSIWSICKPGVTSFKRLEERSAISPPALSVTRISPPLSMSSWSGSRRRQYRCILFSLALPLRGTTIGDIQVSPASGDG